MAKTDGLHELIRSLTKTEKRHFKVSVSSPFQGAEHRYLELFDVLAGMENFDPNQIQSKMQWESFKKSYPVAKKYLQEKILNGLHAYQKKNNTPRRLKEIIAHVEVLMDRNLHRQAAKKIAHGKRLGEKAEALIQLLEILLLQRRLMISDKNNIFGKLDLLKLNEEIQHALDGIRLRQDATNIHHRFFSLLNLHGGSPDDQKLKELESLIQELFALKAVEKPYFFPKVSHHNVLNQFYLIRGDFHQSHQHSGKIIDLFEAQPVMKKELDRTYISCLHNYANRCLSIRDFKSAIDCARIMQAFKASEAAVDTLRRESYLALGISLVSNSGQARQNPRFLADFQDTLENPNLGFSRRFILSLKLVFTACHLQESNFQTGLSLIQQILADPSHSAMRLYKRLVPALEMLLHCEMGNYDWLEYRIRNQLENSKSDSAFAFEPIFYRFLRGLIRAKGKQEIRSAAERFFEHIAPLKEDSKEAAVFNFFHFEDWVEAKSRSLSYRDVVQEQWKAENGDLEVNLD